MSIFNDTLKMNSKIIENVKMNIKNGMELFDKIGLEHGFEVWKIIDGYTNYSVSSFGRVRNDKKENIMKPRISTHGYYQVGLYKNGKQKLCKIHRLLANAFIPNPENKKCVDHIDNIITNNKLNNLRFATKSENGQNRKLNNNNTSNVKGVCWNKRRKKWHARIDLNGKRFNIGYYETFEDAKIARQSKAFKLYGDYMNKCEQ